MDEFRIQDCKANSFDKYQVAFFGEPQANFFNIHINWLFLVKYKYYLNRISNYSHNLRVYYTENDSMKYLLYERFNQFELYN